ncbi:hypothetical protein IGI04_011817 [Brassica rapa subsp. trilocularis]|uniref:DUF4005 domain-containing protein n=1 Tax=Brassica rapa subsp. trilocularis TaxID=1813537 RepID=A0ABQ7N460_BRACM|nr:hypothetical protein IGI04_011817 [Brassica rapa subsp. trilocularis]
MKLTANSILRLNASIKLSRQSPVQTAPQGNKPVSKLKLKLGKESEKFSPFIERRHGNKVLSTTEEEMRVVRRQHDLTSFRWLRAERRSGFPPTSDANFTNRWLKAGRRSGFPPTSDARFKNSCEIRRRPDMGDGKDGAGERNIWSPEWSPTYIGRRIRRIDINCRERNMCSDSRPDSGEIQTIQQDNKNFKSPQLE